MANEEQRFWSKVDTSGGPTACWPWTAVCNGAGYGRFWLNRGQYLAHRRSYERTAGPIPAGMHVCHTCDNPPCVNPGHLFLGTNLDNIADRHSKGRSRGPAPEAMPQWRHPEITQGENNGNAKLTWDSVRAIRAAYCSGSSPRLLSEKYGVCVSNIRLIVTAKTWRPA